MTLVEVLVVVSIMALVAGAVAILVFPQAQRARITKAVMDGKTIRGAVDLHRSIGGDGGCPTVEALVEAERIDGDDRLDPWGTGYRIVCEGAKVRVVSSGPDRRAGTADDVWSHFRSEDIDRVAGL